MVGLSVSGLVYLWAVTAPDPVGPGQGASVSGTQSPAFGPWRLRALLHYDGRDPVNVVHFLAVFVILQSALVVLTVILMSYRAVLPRVANFGLLHECLRYLGHRGIGRRLAGLGGGHTARK